MSSLEVVKPLGRLGKIADAFMLPIMIVLGRFKKDSIQETHPWHIKNISPSDVDPTKVLLVNGAKEKVGDRYGPLFHMFWGWKNYILIESNGPFYIGWIFYKDGSNTPAQSAVNLLIINDDRIRMLSGPKGSKTLFFAVDNKGRQLPIRKAGQGQLGDSKFPGTRLL